MIEQHLAAVSEYLVLYSSNYEKILILRDFHVNVKESVVVITMASRL